MSHDALLLSSKRGEACVWPAKWAEEGEGEGAPRQLVLSLNCRYDEKGAEGQRINIMPVITPAYIFLRGHED